jgi:hypothetical protein
LAAGVHDYDATLEGTRGCFYLAQRKFGRGVARVEEQPHRRGGGNEFADQLEPFSQQLESDDAYAGDVASRTIEARNEAEVHRIATGDEYDRNGRGRRLSRQRTRGGHGGYHRRLPASQIGSQRRQSIEATLGPPVFNGQVLSFGIAAFAEAETERGEQTRRLAGRPAA